MDISPPLVVTEWRGFLHNYSSEFLNSDFLREMEKEGRAPWFADLESDLLAVWSEPGMEFFGDQIKLLERCLLISNDDGGSGHYLLLHADNITESGEWAAYEWWPGDGDDPEPHDNFAALVAGLWKDVTDPEKD